MKSLPLLFQSIALAALAGCGGSQIDRAPFVASVCDADGYHPFRGIKPSGTVDGAVLHMGASDDTFGTLCSKAMNADACRKAVATNADPNAGWFAPSSGDALHAPHTVVTTSGDEVRHLVTISELRALLGVIDTAKEAALLVTETTTHRISCGEKNVHSLQDGSFEILATTGTGCGDDIELHVVRVKRDGSIEVTERETIKRGDPNCQIGRRFEGFSDNAPMSENLGAFFGHMAHLEAAAVPAFERLARELAAHGAPKRLIAAARRSARDEVRHAAAVARLARRFGGTVPPLVVEELPIRSLEAIATENAAEGCVRETFGALVATYQANAARDPQIAKVMRGIARDETRHAQLSWEIASWAARQLDDAAHARIDGVVRAAVRQLRVDLTTPVCDEAIALAGFPGTDRAAALFDAIAPQLWAA